MFASSLSQSVVSLAGCGLCAGASVARLSVSPSCCGRIAFVFPSLVWASRFESVLGGFDWVSLVAHVRRRGSVVVVALWGSHFPVSPPAVPLAGPVSSARPAWCGVAGPVLRSVPAWGAVRVGRWSPVAFFLRGLGFVQSPFGNGSVWDLPSGVPSPVRRCAVAARGARLFGFSLGFCRPFVAAAPSSCGGGWGVVVLATA